jgi:hypothetical protein
MAFPAIGQNPRSQAGSQTVQGIKHIPWVGLDGDLSGNFILIPYLEEEG